MPGRGLLGLLLALVALAAGAVYAGEGKSYAPPPDTPVIPWTRFSVQYAVRVVGNTGPDKVVFYITKDGGASWQLYGEDRDLKSPMNVTVPGEGAYGFITAIATQNRPAAAPRSGTRPDRFVIVDRTPPTARWISPAPGAMAVNGEGSMTLAWETSDSHLGPRPVNLQYSTDSGRSWLPLRENLPAKGSINWIPPTSAGESELMLRLSVKDLAGNTTLLKNKAQFSLDREPPAVAVTGPAASSKYEFDVTYNAEDRQSGVGIVELFYTTNGGADWFYFGKDEDLTSPIRFRTPPARRVGLYIAAADKRGNRIPIPVKGTRPMFEVDLDLEAPMVNILPPFTSATLKIRQNQPVAVRWSAADLNILENSAKIDYSTDGGSRWQILAEKLPANGNWSWVPSFRGDNVLLRVGVADRMGNIGYGLSAPFGIDDRAPETVITSVKPNGGVAERVTPTERTSAADPWKPVMPEEGEGDLINPPGMVNENGEPVTHTPISSSADVTAPVIPSSTDDSTAVDTGKSAAPFDIPPIAQVDATDKKATPVEVNSAGSAEMEIPPLPGEAGKPIERTTSEISSPPSTQTTAEKVEDTTLRPASDSVAKPLSEDNLAIPPIPGGSGEEEVSKPIQPIELPPIDAVVEKKGIKKPASTQDVGQMLDQADQLFASGTRYDEAEKLARQVIAKEPNNPRAFALLASVLTEKGKFEDAIASADRAMQLAPAESRYMQVYGYAQYTKANSIYQDITQKKIPDAQIGAFTAQVVQALAKSEQAYARVLGAKEPLEVKEAYYRLGQIDYFRATKLARDTELKMQGLRKAVENYQKAFGIGGPDYREVLQLGICSYRLGEYDQAERWLEKAQEVSTQARPPKEAIFYLAMIQMKMKRYQQALPLWEKVAQQYEEGSRFKSMAQEKISEIKAQLGGTR